MLYAKLRTARHYQEEITYYKEAIAKAKSGDPLTEKGMQKLEEVPKLAARLEIAKAAFEDIKNSILNDEKFKNMDVILKNACIEYYFKKCKLEDAKGLSSGSFLKDTRNYCHSI